MSQMHITVSGNVIFAPEFIRFDNDKYLTKFRVATSRAYRSGETDKNNNPIWQETDVLYLDVECWGQLAVNAGASLFRGAPVIVTGHLVTDVWEDPSDPDDNGKPRAKQKIILKAARVAFDLSNHQVSSKKTTAQSNTPNGMEQVEVKSAADLAAEATPVRRSAEDQVASQGAPAGAPAGASAAGSAGEEAPF